MVQIKEERERRYQQALKEWEDAIALWEANGKEGKKPRKPKKPKVVPLLERELLIDLPNLPNHWKWIFHGEILANIEAGKSFRCDEKPPQTNEFGVAKVSAVTWGEYNELESKTCFDNQLFQEKWRIEKGDFLFSRANTIELVGACVIVNKVSLNIMLSDKILRFFYIEPTDQTFALHFLRSQYGRKEIESLSTGNQESMRNMGQDRIKRIRFPLPSISEQQKIVEEIESRFSICDRLEADIQTNLKKAEALRQSILKQAFEGKLVPQDPNDEPASVLLERIKTEKEKLAAKTKKTETKRKPRKSTKAKPTQLTLET